MTSAVFERRPAGLVHWERMRAPAIADLVCSYLPVSTGIAVEVGSGSGALADEVLARTGFDAVVCLDVSPQPAHFNSATRPVCANAEALPFRDAAVDFVYSYGTLHHVDHSIALAEIRRVLKPTGLAVVVDFIADGGRHRSKWTLVLAALRAFRGYWCRLGPIDAIRITAFRLSPSWLNHATTDEFLTCEEFVRLHRSAVPDVRFHNIPGAMTAIWGNNTAPAWAPGR